jgi:hypothetical protein
MAIAVVSNEGRVIYFGRMEDIGARKRIAHAQTHCCSWIVCRSGPRLAMSTTIWPSG